MELIWVSLGLASIVFICACKPLGCQAYLILDWSNNDLWLT